MGERFHPVTTKFWKDEKVEAWDTDTRFLALYLLTCPHRTTEGLFRLPKQYILADTGWSPERLEIPFGILLRDGFIRYDDRVSVILLTHALKYQPPKGEKQYKGALNALKELPKTPLLSDFLALAKEYAKGFAEWLVKEYPDGYPIGYGKGYEEGYGIQQTLTHTQTQEHNPPLPPLNPPEGDETHQTPPSSQDDPVDDLVRKIGGYLHGYTKSPFGPTMKDEMTIRGWVAEGATLDMFPEVFKRGLEAFQRKRGNGMVPDHAAWYSPFVAKEIERKRSHQLREPPKYPDLDEILGDD